MSSANQDLLNPKDEKCIFFVLVSYGMNFWCVVF